MDLEELVTYRCTSLAWVTKWLFLENQQSVPPWLDLPSGRRYPRQSAIPQGVDDVFIQDGMALLHTFTKLPPTCCEICIQILDQTTISTDSYHPGSIKAQKRLTRSSPEIILAGSAIRQPYYSKSFHANYDTKNSYVSDAVWIVKEAWFPCWTEQLCQSSSWKVQLINLLQHIAR